MDRFTISPRAAQTRDLLRGEMASRISQIDGWLRPAGEDLATREVAGIFAVMLVRGMGDGEADAMMAVYVRDLSDLPAFALAEACRAYRTGRLGDGKWAPTPGEIYQAAQKAMDGPIAERHDLGMILDAEIERPRIDGGRKAQLLAELDQVKASLRAAIPKNELARGFVAEDAKPVLDMRAVPEPARKRVISETIMAELAEKAKIYAATPITLSSAALRSCGIAPPDTSGPDFDQMREVI